MNTGENKVLDMALKKPYIEAIRIGAKTIEYRTATEYWTKKLVDETKYPNMTTKEIMDGLHDGTLVLYPKDWTHILFHESGSDTTLRVRVRYIKFLKGHHGFFIGTSLEDK